MSVFLLIRHVNQNETASSLKQDFETVGSFMRQYVALVTLLFASMKAIVLLLLLTINSMNALLRNYYPIVRIIKSEKQFSPRLINDIKFSKVSSNIALKSSKEGMELIGEDAATFSLEQQDLKSWAAFLVAVSGVLGVLYYVWLYDGGLGWGDHYKIIMENIAGGDSTFAITYMLGFFAFCHSGLASLRPYAEEIVGARVWRYLFALVSLPLAFSSIVYFINHRYDGIQLWDFRQEPWMHDFVWWSSLVSFLFLYPSTFNLLEIAAVEKPTLHLWETGIARITRHPQAIGQLIWCAAHTAYMGTSFMCATSAMLCAHHLFAVWNGDRRLRDKFGDRADAIREKTSVIPFAAILSGKQQLPDNYITELLRPPYAIIIGGSMAAYYAHPFMQAGATLVGW